MKDINDFDYLDADYNPFRFLYEGYYDFVIKKEIKEDTIEEDNMTFL